MTNEPGLEDVDRGVRTVPLDVLVVDDDLDNARTIAEALAERGHRPVTVGDGTEAIRRLQQHAFDLVICDVRLPGVDGMDILRRIRSERLGAEAIMMSAYGTIPQAVDALKLDAVHYLTKPFALSELIEIVEQISRRIGLDAVRDWARATLGENPESGIVGETALMVGLKRKLAVIARADGPLLITGETGVGKELVARTVHALSPRADMPYVAVNCAAFPESLIEAELFGHESREGTFAAAEGGTLFLDEISEIPPTTQARLLRVLEDRAFQPLGSNQSRPSDVRTIAATDVDIAAAAESGRFRRDLYYRLKLFHVHVPPLRERRADIALLVEHFCSQMAERPPKIAPRAWAALLHYDYPGNVRQLRHAIAHAVAMSDGATIDLEHLPADLAPETAPRPDDDEVRNLQEAGREFERGYVLRALRKTGWNRTRTAELLGISRKTLWKKMRSLGLREPRPEDLTPRQEST